MSKHPHRIVLALALLLALWLAAVPALGQSAVTVSASEHPVEADGEYSAMEEVAVYLATYGELPPNYLTKAQAERLGWKTKGDLDEVAPGCSIGGDRFGNYEGLLPDKKGRSWTECDIGYRGGSRGAKRLIFSNDGLMYYTSDHYASFTPVEVDRDAEPAGGVLRGEAYTAAADVAVYLHLYGELPPNYLTKAEAKKLGWSAKKDDLGAVAPGCAIGGEKFGNREGLLPDRQGRKWFECDVNAPDGKRGPERLVYSSDGLIYYTADSHKTFTKLY